MRWTAALLALGLGVASAPAGETPGTAGAPAPDPPPPAAPSVASSSRSAWDSTVITEATADGRQVTAPTADQPAYVVTHSGGQHDFGLVPAGEKTPPAGTLDQPLQQALGRLHYLPADAGHPPSVLIVFSWGIHCYPGDDAEDRGYRNLLDRAALAGGTRFADELQKVLVQAGDLASAVSTEAFGPQMPGKRPAIAASLFQPASPIETLRRRDVKTEFLVGQITNDCYYVVISAFDYASVVRGKQQLLWRTKLTTVARGVSMAAAIPALIANSAGYLGRDMSAPELFANGGR